MQTTVKSFQNSTAAGLASELSKFFENNPQVAIKDLSYLHTTKNQSASLPMPSQDLYTAFLCYEHR